MVLVTINNLPVDFPYDPYPQQLRYMSAVIEALRHRSNALLESPTGTGKTLCLLCATLAWRASYIAALQTHAHARPDLPQTNTATSLIQNVGLHSHGPQPSALAVLSSNPGTAVQLAVPKIIFASRTHSQLSQAIAELKKTEYTPSIAFLASRDQYCVHDMSSTLSGYRLNSMCRRITAPVRRSCRFHLPIASSRPHENRSTELIEKLQAQPPMDIEDLRTFGLSEGACPYFLSRAAARSELCEILFLPYNYLLDKAARSSLDIDWTNDVVIIDEAHNLENICSDAMSFDLTSSARQSVDTELSKLIETAVRPGGIHIPALENQLNSDAGVDNIIGTENNTLLEIRTLRSILKAIDSFISSTQMDRGQATDIQFAVLDPNKLRAIIQDAGGPTLETYDLFVESLDRAMEFQAETAKLNETRAVGDDSSAGAGNNALRLFQTAIRILYEGVTRKEDNAFRVVVHFATSQTNAGRTLSYWCFNPACAMRELTKINLRSILLTSGTLAPLEAFGSELGLPFPVRLENPHVITKPQIWTGVMKTGPDSFGCKGSRLTSAYAFRGEVSTLELGRALIRIGGIVPDGLLVFFPSYNLLYYAVEVWRRLGPGADRAKPSVWEHLCNVKPVVVEERDASKTAAAILAHRANVDSGNGSMLLAVCRGKVSEGIDFSDEYGRAVVITGLPFPSAMDPRVILKREYADQNFREQTQPKGAERVLNGTQWYTTQTLRAVNQAVGRAIRHKVDYGAILLCDERFQAGHLQSLISKWIRPRLATYANFSSAEESLKRFFVSAKESNFAQVARTRRSEANRKSEARAARSGNRDTAAVQIAQNALSKMMPSTPKVDKAFMEHMVSMSDALEANDPRHPVGNGMSCQHEEASTFLSAFNFSQRSTTGHNVLSNTSENNKRTVHMRRELLRKGSASQGDGDQPAAKRRRKENQDSSNSEKLSEKLKRIFETKEDVRSFLKLFREILGADSATRNNEGEALARSKALGRSAVCKMIQFARGHGKEGTEQLLKELRRRVPATLQAEFDMELEKR